MRPFEALIFQYAKIGMIIFRREFHGTLWAGAPGVRSSR
jgi:hypothetical protein